VEDGLRRLLVAGRASSSGCSSVSGQCPRSRCGAGCWGTKTFPDESEYEVPTAAPEALVLREEAVVNFVRTRMREEEELANEQSSPGSPIGSPSVVADRYGRSPLGSVLGVPRLDDPAERFAAEPFGGYLAHQLIEPKVPNMPAFVVPRVSLRSRAASPEGRDIPARIQRTPAKQPEKPAQEAPEEESFEDFDFDSRSLCEYTTGDREQPEAVENSSVQQQHMSQCRQYEDQEQQSTTQQVLLEAPPAG